LKSEGGREQERRDAKAHLGNLPYKWKERSFKKRGVNEKG